MYSDCFFLTDRCVVISCLLISLVMLIDTYRSMTVRFTLPTTRGFLLSLLSLSSRLFTVKENLWDQGNLYPILILKMHSAQLGLAVISLISLLLKRDFN